MKPRVFAAVVALVVCHEAAGHARQPDPERLLTSRFGFTDAEVAQVRSGQAVAKLLPVNDATDVGVAGAVRIDTDPKRLVAWIKEIAQFRRAAQLGDARRLSNPPVAADFADLALDPKDIAALKACRPGACELRLGDTALQRLQKDVDWNAADAASRANAAVRQLLADHARAYLAGGDAMLGMAHNEKAPRAVVEDFHQILWQSKAVYDLAPPLAAYLEGFPAAPLPFSEQFLYWAKNTADSDAVISLHQMVIYHPSAGQVYIADKQIYASRTVDSALTVISLASPPNGSGFYALIGARARSKLLQGAGARVLRGKVERAARDTAAMYLNWIRESLAG